MESPIAIPHASIDDARFKKIADAMMADFWTAYREAFPEVTGGESRMADEPESGMAAWLTRATGYELQEDSNMHYTMPLNPESGLESLPEHAPDDLEDRALQMVRDGLARAGARIQQELGIATVAPADVVLHMTGCVHDVLYRNFPEGALSVAYN